MRKTVILTSYVDIEVDETKFTDEFMVDFRQSFYEFNTLDDHLAHLARLADGNNFYLLSKFIEGYGEPDDFGIKIHGINYDSEVE
jgi:hypothetical protein